MGNSNDWNSGPLHPDESSDDWGLSQLPISRDLDPMHQGTLAGCEVPMRCDEPEPAPAPQTGVREWKFACSHTIDDAPRIVEHVTTFRVVPDALETPDNVEVLLKDTVDEPPSSVRFVEGSTREATDVASASTDGEGFSAFPLPAKFIGPIDKDDFLDRRFWNQVNRITTYRARVPDFGSLGVEVHYPYRWKLQVSLPPTRATKFGVKWEAANVRRQGGGARRVERTATVSASQTNWGRSGQNTESFTHTSGDRSEVEATSETGAAVPAGIKFERSDGLTAQLNMLELIGAIAKFIDDFNKIKDAIVEFAPRIGWYMEAGIQFFQGGASFEFGWKEYRDHRSFFWLDGKAELTIVNVTFEVGVGVSVPGFEAQIFAQLGGALKVELDVARTSPDNDAELKLPVEGSLTGAVGARVRVAFVGNAVAQGETALKLRAELGLRTAGNRPINVDLAAEWTGLKVSIVAGIGHGGSGGQDRIAEKQLVGPKVLGTLQWPKREVYRTAYLSRTQIHAIVLAQLNRGWDITVYTPGVRTGRRLVGQETMPNIEVANYIVHAVDGAENLRRDQTTIEGLALAIRSDLAEYSFDNRVTTDEFSAYLNGEKLANRLAEAFDAGQAFVDQCTV